MICRANVTLARFLGILVCAHKSSMHGLKSIDGKETAEFGPELKLVLSQILSITTDIVVGFINMYGPLIYGWAWWQPCLLEVCTLGCEFM